MADTTTVIGRSKLVHADLGYTGGSALHTLQSNLFKNLSDNLNSRYKEFAGILDSTTVELDHNFGVAFDELSISIFTGSGTNLTKVSSPLANGWTLNAKVGSLKTILEITTPSSGGPHTFAVQCVVGGSGSGGLTPIEVTVTGTTPSVSTLSAGNTYLIDMTSASGDITVNLPAGFAGDIVKISVWGQSTSGKHVTVIPNGAEIIWYNETSNASKKIGQTSNWMEFIFDVGKGWIANDSSSGSGSSSGEKNYIENPSAAIDTTGWVASSAGISISRATDAMPSLLPREFTTKTALGFSSDIDEAYVRYRFSLDDVDLNRKLKIALALRTSVATWRIEMHSNASSDYSEAYTKINLSTDASGNSYLPATTTTYVTSFDSASSPYLELRIVHNGAVSDGINVSDVIVGPGTIIQGAVISEWISYTPFFSTSGAPTTNITAYVTKTGYYRRVGSSIECNINIKAETGFSCTAGIFLFSIPTGLTIDTTKIVTNTTGVGIGTARIRNHGAPQDDSGIVQYTENGDIVIALTDRAAGNILTDAVPYTFDANHQVALTFTVPVAEWAGSGTVNLGENDVEYAYNSDDSGADDTTSFAYGPTGVRFPNRTVGTMVAKTVKFQHPIQPGEVYQLQYTDGSTAWQTCDSRFPYMRQNTSVYGFDMYQINSTTIIVRFCAQGAMASGATYGANGIGWDTIYTQGWRWRVVKHRAGAAVGFGIVNPGVSAGLVSANGLPGRTDGVEVGAGYVGEEAANTAGYATCKGAGNTLVVTKTLDVGTWLVIASTNAAMNTAQTGHKSTIGIKGTAGSVAGYDICYFDAKTNNSQGTINFPNRVVTIASDDADKTIKLYDVAFGADQPYGCWGHISAIRIA